jgi:esterase/lipase superfamily enzyme
MGVVVYGHYGTPILAFPTSGGDEWEQEGQGMIRTLGPYLEQGRIRIFSINGVNNDTFQNKSAHPFHRSWLHAQYAAYVANEIFPSSTRNARHPASRSPRSVRRSAPSTRRTSSSSIPTR